MVCMHGNKSYHYFYILVDLPTVCLQPSAAPLSAILLPRYQFSQQLQILFDLMYCLVLPLSKHMSSIHVCSFTAVSKLLIVLKWWIIRMYVKSINCDNHFCLVQIHKLCFHVIWNVLSHKINSSIL